MIARPPFLPLAMVIGIPLLAVCRDAGGSLGPCVAADCPSDPAAVDSFPAALIEVGGLYGAGENAPPAFHREAGIQAGNQVPRTGAVFATVGMSNTLLEFQSLSDRSANITDAIIATTACWACIVNAWDTDSGRGWTKANLWLTRRGYAPEDVDVVWLKVTRGKDLAVTSGDLERIMGVMKRQWPNVKQVYVSDRIYTGYLGPGVEPSGGWNAGPAVRAFILEHLGETDPWIGWGPYLWANGETERADGLEWRRSDYEDDMLHPNAEGASKVADLLIEFLSSAPEAAWFRREPS